MNAVFRVGKALASCALLIICMLPYATAQSWAPTATQAYPVRYLTNPVLVGPVAASTPMHIVVGLQERNVNQVQPTLRSMLTTGNPLYGTSLTVQQFATQFGATNGQVNAVTSYLSDAGFTNVQVAENNLLIEADGTAGLVQSAFHTTLEEYSISGGKVYLNTSAAEVPTSLSGIVIAVLGLNNVVSVHSALIKLNTTANPQTAPCTPPECPTPDASNETYSAQQYQIAYDAADPGSTPNATQLQQKIATGCCAAVGIIAEGDLTQVVKDLRTYETTYKLPQVPVTVVNAGIPSPDTSGADEWDLDSQTSTGIAQQVSHLYFYAATSMTDSDLGLAINRAVTSNQVKAFNMSFGECEFFPYIDGAMLVDDEIFGEAALPLAR